MSITKHLWMVFIYKFITNKGIAIKILAHRFKKNNSSVDTIILIFT